MCRLASTSSSVTDGREREREGGGEGNLKRERERGGGGVKEAGRGVIFRELWREMSEA